MIILYWLLGMLVVPPVFYVVICFLRDGWLHVLNITKGDKDND